METQSEQPTNQRVYIYDVVKRVATYTGENETVVRRLFLCILEEMKKNLLEGKSIMLSKFLRLQINAHKNSRNGVGAPSDGVSIGCNAHMLSHFKEEARKRTKEIQKGIEQREAFNLNVFTKRVKNIEKFKEDVVKRIHKSKAKV